MILLRTANIITTGECIRQENVSQEADEVHKLTLSGFSYSLHACFSFSSPHSCTAQLHHHRVYDIARTTRFYALAGPVAEY